MGKISFDFFDFFGATLPGIPIFIISSFLVASSPFSFSMLALHLHESSLYEITVALIVSYSIGFCFHYPSYELFKPLVSLWGKKRTLGLPISIGKREKELAKIRHDSPENFKLISKFMALRQMAYSMFFSLLLFILGAIILAKMTSNWNRDTILAITFSFLFGFLFLRRAVAFHQRIQEMITEASVL